MLILVEIAVALLLIGGVVNYFLGRRKDAERAAVTARRVEAYVETIRRERKNPELTAMSDTELRDVLESGARNLRVLSERRFYVLLGGAVITLLVAVFVATDNGLAGFGVAIAVGGLALYGLYEFLGRRMREPLEVLGIDAERLRVE